MEGVTIAFVNKGIILLLDHDEPLDVEAVKTVLKPFKMQVANAQKADQLPF